MRKNKKAFFLIVIIILVIAVRNVRADANNDVAYWCKYEDDVNQNRVVVSLNKWFYPTNNENKSCQDSYYVNDKGQTKKGKIWPCYRAGRVEREDGWGKGKYEDSGERYSKYVEVYVTNWAPKISEGLTKTHPCPNFMIYDRQGITWKREVSLGIGWAEIEEYSPEMKNKEENIYLRLTTMRDTTGEDDKIIEYSNSGHNVPTESNVYYEDDYGQYVIDENGNKSYFGSIKPETIDYENFSLCERKGVLQMFRIIGLFKEIIKILVPVLLIVFASIDIGKALLGGDDKDFQNSIRVSVKRLIAGLVIFFVPTIVDTIINQLYSYNRDDYYNVNGKGEFAKCSLCFASPKVENCEDQSTIVDLKLPE